MRAFFSGVHLLIQASYVGLVVAAAGAMGCAAATPGDEAETQEGGATGVRTGAGSTNAKSGARYMEVRSFEALEEIGAVSEVQKSVVARMRRYGRKDFGVDALMFAEDAARWPTFLPEEQRAFPSLWALLEIDKGIDVDAAPAFPALASIVATKTPETARYDENGRVPIGSLPEGLREIAQRVIKTAGVDPTTVSFAEVVQALADYAKYPSSEYFRFDALLRAIERLAAKPPSFPHLAIEAPLDGAIDVDVGPASLHVARTSTRACDSQYRGASIATLTRLTASAPNDVKLTWTALSPEARLANAQSDYGELSIVPVTSTGARFPTTLRVRGGGRAAAIVDAYRGTDHVGQAHVVLTGDESMNGSGLAIAESGAFVCTPFDDAADASTSLANVVRLPPGRYAIPTPTYGQATLSLYGAGVMRLDVGGKSFWRVNPPEAYAPSARMCWELTSLGPKNEVTGASGAGPGFRFDFATNEVFFAETSYGVCPYQQRGSGTKVATLTPSNR